MTKVLVFGTFDGLHEGHRDFFRQAKEYGDYLIVVVGRDSTVQKTKGKMPKFNKEERLKAMQDSSLVDEARLGNESVPDEKFDPYKIIQEIKPDVICLGYDQTHFVDKLEVKLKEMGLVRVKIKHLKAYKPEMYKSSLLNK